MSRGGEAHSALTAHPSALLQYLKFACGWLALAVAEMSPTPGVAALLGLGGLAAARRRR